MPARRFLAPKCSKSVAFVLLCLLVASAASAAQEADVAEGGGGSGGDNRSGSNSGTATVFADNPELRVTAGSPAANSRHSYICSLRSAASADSDSFCGCSLVAPRIVLTAAHCLDQDDPSLRQPTVDLGRRRRTGPADEEGVVRRRCARSVVHPSWSFATTRHDISLCYLDEPVEGWEPVPLASSAGGGDGRNNDLGTVSPLAIGTPLAVIGWGTTRPGAPEQSPALMRAEVPVFEFDACNALFKGVLGRGQMCAGSTARNGHELVADACQGDSGGPLVLEGGDNGGDNDVLVGIVSFGESCGVLPGVYTDVAAYRRWISDTILDTAAEAGLSPDDVEQILPAALGDDNAEERSAAVVKEEEGGGGGGGGEEVLAAASAQVQLRPAVVDVDGARAALADARAQRAEAAAGGGFSSSLTAVSVPAVSSATTTADLTKALASMILLSGAGDPCACMAEASAAGAGGCRPLLVVGPSAREYGCYVRGGAGCALATEVGGGLYARGCRPTPSELWTARAASASAAAAAAKSGSGGGVRMRRWGAAPAACPAGGGGTGASSCASPSLRGAAAGAAVPLVDPSRPGGGGGGKNSLPRVLWASFRVGFAESLRINAAPLHPPKPAVKVLRAAATAAKTASGRK